VCCYLRKEKDTTDKTPTLLLRWCCCLCVALFSIYFQIIRDHRLKSSRVIHCPHVRHPCISCRCWKCIFESWICWRRFSGDDNSFSCAEMCEVCYFVLSILFHVLLLKALEETLLAKNDFDTNRSVHPIRRGVVKIGNNWKPYGKLCSMMLG
jgi:hypothetical protein